MMFQERVKYYNGILSIEYMILIIVLYWRASMFSLWILVLFQKISEEPGYFDYFLSCQSKSESFVNSSIFWSRISSVVQTMSSNLWKTFDFSINWHQ